MTPTATIKESIDIFRSVEVRWSERYKHTIVVVGWDSEGDLVEIAVDRNVPVSRLAEQYRIVVETLILLSPWLSQTVDNVDRKET